MGAVEGWGGATAVVFGWNRAVIVQNFSVLLGFPFPGYLAKESRFLLGLFFF